MKKSILITAVSGDLGYSVVQALEELNIPLVGCDMSPYCPVLNKLSAFHLVPPSSNPNYLDSILDISRKHNINCIFPCSEPEIIFFSENRDYFLKNDVHLAINDSFTLKFFFDKYLTIQYLKKLGLNTPQTYLLKEYKKELTYPLVIKDICGSGSKNLHIVEDEHSFNVLQPNLVDKNVIVQECLGTIDNEYTTAAYADGFSISTITFKRKLRGGVSVLVEPIHSPFMQSFAEKLFNAHPFVGSINIQTRRVGEEYIPFEINPRLSSTVLFRKFYGFKDAQWWYESLMHNSRHEFIPKNFEYLGIKMNSDVFIKSNGEV